MSGYPVQAGKVQRPPLRDETLARDRLLDWLNVKIHNRIVCVLAEAGYGKTTLLADFSRRSRHRTLWYRLDEEDRNWIAFLSYLVAAGRELDPAFAPSTASLLRELGTTGPQLEAVLETFTREFQVLGEAGAILILDDYHVVDEAPDVRQIVKQLIARAPDRVTFVIASRRSPSLPIARLRALGEVAELTTDDLRFNEAETERLFRETYRRPLEPDVLNDLSRRTEGWAASLQLVQAAIRGRTGGEVRSFVRSLSGAEGDLYDYLAEEVVGVLPAEIQRFLMEAAFLEVVAPAVAAVAADVPVQQAKQTVVDCERLGLLTRRAEDGRATYRFHPLVREFLRQRFAREYGEGSIRALHERIAADAEQRGDWVTGTHHLAELGDQDRVARALGTAVPQIMGRGEYLQAMSLLQRFPALPPSPEFEVIRSRVEFATGDYAAALARARTARTDAPTNEFVVANLLALEMMAGDTSSAIRIAEELAALQASPTLHAIGETAATVLRASTDAHLPSSADDLRLLASQHEEAGLYRYQGITLLNLAAVVRAMGQGEDCLNAALQAGSLLEHSGGPPEQSACVALRAWALANVGRWRECIETLGSLPEDLPDLVRAEMLLEEAMIHAEYGEAEIARDLVEEAETYLGLMPTLDEQWRVAAIEAQLRLGDIAAAKRTAHRMALGSHVSIPGHHVHQMTLHARIASASGDGDARAMVRSARALAARQGSWFRAGQLDLLLAAGMSAAAWNRALRASLSASPAVVTSMADVVAARLEDIDGDLLSQLRVDLDVRPLPWRRALREILGRRRAPRLLAAELLEAIGEPADIERLRRVARELKAPGLGRGLARRLAAPVWIEDQGRVTISIGGAPVPSSSVRRKVLASICYLLTRPGFSATRDEILEAMWPDLPPDVAVNSLNQTVYFMRRVFEPGYQELVSPGYVHHDSDVVWLDGQLCQARSAACWALLRNLPAQPDPEAVTRLSDMYRGRFALDFTYEDWAASYRDSLHAAYLQVIETAVTADMESGHYARAIQLARRALEVEPTAEQLELSLLRLYQITGAHAAAAEQYAHYAAALRTELGVEAPPLGELLAASQDR